MNRILVASAILLAFALPAAAPTHAQDMPAPEYLQRAAGPPPTGKAPGLKANELNPRVRTFQITFAKGDEVAAGLAEFAEKNHLTASHFTAIGAFDHAVIGWQDPEKRAFKIIRLNEEMEVTSFVGNIRRDANGRAVVHAHCTVALLRNGQVYSGHFVEGQISLTMQMTLEDSEPLTAATAGR